MLWVLLKKQLTEDFRSYFYDPRKNVMRSPGAVIGMFALFFGVMILLLGGSFFTLAISFCAPLHEVGAGWLYFLLMSGMATAIGVLCSVFSTYSSLYLGKDNDLLLSMPIPVRTIITSRLLNVFIMSVMYISMVLVPALLVYWLTVGVTLLNLIGGLLLFVIVSLFVLMLTCLLGWCMAKITVRMKNKSYVTVIASLAFMVGYFAVYSNINIYIDKLIENAEEVSKNFKASYYPLYILGRVGEGDLAAGGIVAAVTAVCLVIVWIILSRSFISIATASAGASKVRYNGKTIKQKSPYNALIAKELKRFTSSANYMLNCGLGLIMLPVLGVALLINGETLRSVAAEAFPGGQNTMALLMAGAICMASCMNDIAAPSVSLEGKSVWIPQSLPVDPKLALRAKAAAQMLLTFPPVLFASVCAAISVGTSLFVRIAMCLLPLMFALFMSVFNTVIAIKLPIMSWTSEVMPIKQSAGVMLAMFGGWAICGVMLVAHAFIPLPFPESYAVYMMVWVGLYGVLFSALLSWLDKKGGRLFAEL